MKLLPKTRVGNILLVGLPLFALILSGVILAQNREPYRDKLAEAQPATLFPLYYPSDLPDGLRATGDDIKANSHLVMFSLRDNNGNPIAVTQQKRPPKVEEVSNTKSIKTPSGKGYIGIVNGRPTGFLEAGRTLVVVTGSSDTELLEKLLATFRPVSD